VSAGAATSGISYRARAHALRALFAIMLSPLYPAAIIVWATREALS
jgi:hypothetical protein